jgi:hypothetical protein
MKFRYAFLLPAALVVGSPVSTDNDRVIVRENGPLTSRDAPVSLPRKIGAKESNELVSREANGRHGHGDFDLGDHKYGQVAQYIYGLTGKISIWNEFGAVDDIQTCSVFKSLEWLAYSLIEPTRDIASHVSEDGQTKSVPFDVRKKPQPLKPWNYRAHQLQIVIRGTQMWTKILDSLKLQLWATQSYSWSLDTQIHIAECYVNVRKLDLKLKNLVGTDMGEVRQPSCCMA